MALRLLLQSSRGKKVPDKQPDSGVPDEKRTLRYLDASRVRSPLGDLGAFEVRGADDRCIGHVNGVLIDPAERRLRFYVVAPQPAAGRQYLVPTDMPARIDPDRKSLQIDVEPEELDGCQRFESSTVQPFSDLDLLDAVFMRRLA